jgi:phosphotransferase system enzyme I (PtsI)
MIRKMKEAPAILGSEQNGDVRIKGIAVSRGISYGKIVPLFGRKRQYYRSDISPEQIDGELRRVRVAFRYARKQLNRIAYSSPQIPIPEIFDAQIAMLADSSLQEKIETYIKDNLVNAEWALRKVTYEYIRRFKSVADQHIREKYIDLQDVAERVLLALGGGEQKLTLDAGSVIAAKDLRPSTLIELLPTPPAGLLSESGGWTSHTFILARELGIPAITGLKNIEDLIISEKNVIIDGYTGTLIIDPSESTRAAYIKDTAAPEPSNNSPLPTTAKEVFTTDGRKIRILANIDIPKTYTKAKNAGAVGIGLYRSEYLFNMYNGFPDEGRQYRSYGEIGDLAGEDGVNIRLFDIDQSELQMGELGRESNPALGLRGIRLSLSNKKVFSEQVRAVLRAAYKRNIHLVLPMVTSIDEVREARSLIANEKENLKRESVNFGEPLIGVMIETPAAVAIAEHLLEECDFLTLGTNDLVQYLLAVDRNNDAVAAWFQTLHPAVLGAVKHVIDAANTAQKPLTICGEMAGSPYYLPLLIGMGANTLSMNANSVGDVVRLVAGVSYSDTRTLAADVLKSRTAAEAERIIDDFIRSNIAHLYPEKFLSSISNRE